MENINDIENKQGGSKQAKWKKYLAGIVIALITLVSTYFIHTNPVLNLADLTNTGPSGDLTDTLYMPKYEGGIGEEGLLEVKTKADIGSFDSFTFVLNYSPVNALSFENNPIVFDTDTEFQDAAFQMTAAPEDGKLIVTIVLEDPITVAGGIVASNPATHPTLFKLNTQLNSELPVGQVVNITFEDVAMLNGIDPLTWITELPPTTITVAGQNELKVLNAEAIDNTHVAIQFSDYLADRGNITSYDMTPPALNVNLVEDGTAYGFDQKTVVLTTDPQIAGQEYVVTVDPLSTITANEQGDIDPNYSNVLFYGFGQGADVLSDFGMVSASVSGYKTITAVFTDEVEAASVTKADFALSVQGGGTVTIENVSSVTGNQVELLVSTPLLKKNTYLLSAVSPNAILRDSDAAVLGMDRVAFNGAKNGPRLIGATVTNPGGTAYRLQLTFDENIQLAGIANNPVGRLYTTGTAAGTLINDFNISLYNQSISGSTLTLENAVFNAPATNFTFGVSSPAWLTNSSGVAVDDTYKAISFWGYGHNNSTNSVGAVDVTKRDTILVPDGTLDFDQVVLSDVSVLYDSGGASLATEAISAIGLNDDDLEVVMTNSLNPDRHYILRIIDNTVSNTTLAAKDFVIERSLNVASAEAISNTNVRVYFSDNIDEDNVDSTDFNVTGTVPITVNSLTIDPGYQSVTLNTAGPFTAANIFEVEVVNPSDLYAFEGAALLRNTAYFTGYQTLAARSDVILESVTVVDAQTLRMEFSDALSEASFTPVNLDIFWFDNPSDPNSRVPLTVTNITRVSDTTYELTTAVQSAGENYFIVFDGVKDAEGLLLGNSKSVNFFGYTLPEVVISLVTPSVLENDLDTNVVLSGQNLHLVEEVRINNEVMTIVTQSPTSLVFTVPQDFTPDLYNITLIDQASNSQVFESALLVTVPEAALVVHSEQSQSIPLNVPNDGATETTLWLLVEDPVGLASVSSVVVDLSQIGGPSTQEMVKDTGTQPQYSQWYTWTTTVPATVATQDEPYLLPVEVRKGTDTYEGTISVRVTKDVVQSVAPTIDHVYISPISVSPDGETPVKISAQVSDQDGAATLNSVVADLGALGIGFKPLTAIGEVTEGTELETQFFESEEFTVSDTTDPGTYTINVVASDNTGEQTTASLTLQVSTSVSGPKIDKDISYISPRTSIPNDGKTEFSIHVFVSDTDGISDVQSVVANFSTIGLPPVALTRDAEASEGGETAWYSVSGLTIPKTAPLGVHDIEVRASDTGGGLANILLRVDVTHKDTLGDPPRVVGDRAYTTPRVATNDGQTPITLYVFVRDDDDDIESVIANLSTIGQVGPETSGTMGEVSENDELSDGSCPTGSNVLVCMQSSVKEGDNGQWFILPDVTVSTLVSASPHPYQVEVIVTDSGGKTTRGAIPVYVGSGDGIAEQQEPPKVLAVIPTSETSVEILFNKEISANSLSSSGKEFTIASNSDVQDELNIFSATINPAGNVVTLSTDNQVPEKAYVLSVSSNIRDLSGRSVVEGAANRILFTGFKAVNRPPIVEYINATASDTVEIEFRDLLKPSSVRTGFSEAGSSSQFGVTIYESENTSQRLDVYGVELLAPGNVLRVKTGLQKPDLKYRLNIDGLASFDGTSVNTPVNKGFKGYNLSLVQHFAAANLADLNNDGRVDFADFTIFSSVYGTVYFGAGENVAEAAANSTTVSAGQPLEENPDALVPITSTPAGGSTN